MTRTGPVPAPPPAVPARASTPWRDGVGAALGGVVLGVIDLLLQHTLPYPLAELANSSAVWALAAFALGLFGGRSRLRSAALGVVLLVTAVQAYYLASAVGYGDDLAVLLSPATHQWVVYGVVAGTLFGLAGALVREPDPVLRCVGIGAAPAVLVAEAVTLLRVSYDDDRVSVAVVELVLGVGVLAALCWRYTDRRLEVLGTLFAATMLALLGIGLFGGLGYGG